MCHPGKVFCFLPDSLKEACARIFSESVQIPIVVSTTGEKEMRRRVSSQKLSEIGVGRTPFIKELLEKEILIVVGEGCGGFSILEIRCPN